MTKKSKTKRIKMEKYQNEEQHEIVRFVKILIILIILVFGIYLFTRIFVTKDLFNKDIDNKEVISGEINYDITLIGAMLNKPEDEYYVLIYDAKNLNAIYYDGFISTYQRNENTLKVYYANLGNELNKKYQTDENGNINTSDLDIFKVKDLALVKISNGKIIKALADEEDIAEELAYQK